MNKAALNIISPSREETFSAPKLAIEHQATVSRPIAPEWESILLLFGIIQIAMTLTQGFLGPRILPAHRIAATFLAKFVFLNATHVILTFVFLAFSPEARDLLRDSYKAKRSWLLLGFAFIPVATFFCIVQTFHIPMDSRFYKITLLAMVALRSVHRLSQSYGLYLLYPREVTNRPTLISFGMERGIFKSLIWIQILIGLLMVFEPPQLAKWQNWIALAELILISLIVAQAFLGSKKVWSFRPLFIMRLISYPFELTAPILTYALQANHGIEYLAVSQSLFCRGKGKMQTRHFLLACVFAMTLYMFFCLPVMLPTEFKSSYHKMLGKPGLHTVLCFVYTMEYFHYYLDACIFRMRDPLVKNRIGTLLLFESAPISGSRPGQASRDVRC